MKILNKEMLFFSTFETLKNNFELSRKLAKNINFSDYKNRVDLVEDTSK